MAIVRAACSTRWIVNGSWYGSRSVIWSLLLPGDAATAAKPCSRSQIRSSTDSRPTDSRTVPGPTPAAWSSSSLSWRWVVLAGWMIRLFASPTLARCDQSVTLRMRSCPPSRPPAQSNENTAPAPSGRYFSTSGRYLLLGRPAIGHVRWPARATRGTPPPAARWRRGAPSAATASPAPAGTGTR